MQHDVQIIEIGNSISHARGQTIKQLHGPLKLVLQIVQIRSGMVLDVD